MCDLSKAFDSVSPDLLLSKCLNLKNDPFWFHNYLTDRTQSVRIKNYMSNKTSITYGVRQGLVLGAILFTIYVNDLSHAFSECQVIQYADDTQYIHTGDMNDIGCLMSKGEDCISKAGLYYNKNGLLLNVKRPNVCLSGPEDSSPGSPLICTC